MKCNKCPRNCNIDRSKAAGFCGAKDKMVVSLSMLHPYEEPILTRGDEKSGAIFFSGCSLKCVYCQNYPISHQLKGKEVTPLELVNIMKDLENKGAGNIDLVTPTHFASQIIEALKLYKPKIPVIWNTSGYEKPEAIKMLAGLVDIYLTDFKYASPKTAKLLSLAENYPEFASKSLKEMQKQQPKNVFEEGKLVKGIIVRHLVLPTYAKESIAALQKIKEILGKDAIVSIMSQYTPEPCCKIDKINRKITPLEYKIVVSKALELGLSNSFVQDLNSASEKYTPSFINKN